jgi:hypothetical protein
VTGSAVKIVVSGSALWVSAWQAVACAGVEKAAKDRRIASRKRRFRTVAEEYHSPCRKTRLQNAPSGGWSNAISVAK